jgi:hypothetical protein
VEGSDERDMKAANLGVKMTELPTTTSDTFDPEQFKKRKRKVTTKKKGGRNNTSNRRR